jgi:hypothetical protein
MVNGFSAAGYGFVRKALQAVGLRLRVGFIAQSSRAAQVIPSSCICLLLFFWSQAVTDDGFQLWRVKQDNRLPR